MKVNFLHLSMKWKLIFSFAAVTLFFMGVALYQGHKINQVEVSMETQKAEMEKRITVSTITQQLQELNSVETSLAESSDLEFVDSFKDKQKKLVSELSKLGFEENSSESKELELLRSQVGEYTGFFDKLVKTMEDENLDPMTVLEQIDDVHTKALALNTAMLKTNEQLYTAAAENAQQAQDYSFLLLNRTSSVVVYAAGFVFLFTLIIAWMLIRSFLSPVKKLQAALLKISEGDLRQQINSPYNDELGTLSHHFDHMVERVRAMLQQTQSVASALASYSDSFQQSSSITAHTNLDIVRTIQEISVGAEQQAGQSEQSAILIQQLEREVHEITEYTEVMLLTSKTANQNTRQGSAAVIALREVSEQSSQSVGKVYNALNKLVGQSKDISRITNSITEISQQTNILSLNAAIEAARAGTYGKGFAVIADEVRQLSVQTKDSTVHISKIISELQKGMAEFQSNMLETKENLEEQEHKVAETLSSFAAIDHSIAEISKQIGQIHDKVDMTQTMNTRLAESVHSVAAIAEETAAGVQEVNASSMQQDIAIRDIARQAVEINEISQKLFQEINIFKINEDTVVEPTVEAASNPNLVKLHEVETVAFEEPTVAQPTVVQPAAVTPSVEKTVEKEVEKEVEREYAEATA
ncbi:methyl-accepting chemotaxis protein [Paenibacillus sp. 19GGS1-52]|uniref:methyl-accepting chemotaxis protein n=1 Tax=Paenibacillus sp. 19GGS1-52 TaxID=2758563 RepID=UPI001EFBEB91|nr:methyl-accepting chemotaxis protein [Paenibacillus sp. 19GGS1-52]ULO05801.1 methyl-accepting chemotaxis protein [Paenibacillus sp. 19GGS1-52]